MQYPKETGNQPKEISCLGVGFSGDKTGHCIWQSKLQYVLSADEVEQKTAGSCSPDLLLHNLV